MLFTASSDKASAIRFIPSAYDWMALPAKNNRHSMRTTAQRCYILVFGKVR